MKNRTAIYPHQISAAATAAAVDAAGIGSNRRKRIGATENNRKKTTH